MSYEPHQYRDPYASPVADTKWQRPIEPLPHSGLGIASFIMSIAVGFGAFAVVVVAGVIEAQTPGGMDEESPAAIIVGLGFFAVMGANLLGIGLGIAGIAVRDRNKVFAYLGLAFNVMIVLGMCGLIGLGLAMGG